MRWRCFFDDVIFKVIVFPTPIDLLLLILILVELKLWEIFGASQSVARYRITIGSTYMTLLSDLSCLNLLDLLRIDLIDVGGITLDDFNQERVPATLQLLQVVPEFLSDPSEAHHTDPSPPEDCIHGKDHQEEDQGHTKVQVWRNKEQAAIESGEGGDVSLEFEIIDLLSGVGLYLLEYLNVYDHKHKPDECAIQRFEGGQEQVDADHDDLPEVQEDLPVERGVVQPRVQESVPRHVALIGERLSLPVHDDQGQEWETHDPDHDDRDTYVSGVEVVIAYPALQAHVEGQVRLVVLEHINAVVYGECNGGHCRQRDENEDGDRHNQPSQSLRVLLEVAEDEPEGRDQDDADSREDDGEDHLKV